MGQRVAARPRVARRPPAVRSHERPASACFLTIFLTDLGWFGLRGAGDTVHALTIGHASSGEVRVASAAAARAAGVVEPIEEDDWHPSLRRDLESFSKGVRVAFDRVKMEFPRTTEFRRRVWEATRKIRYGSTISYGELAARVGKPNASRAVGGAMAANVLPILIPCHRIVASGGALGGFSAPQGIDLKRRLLALEAARSK